MRLQPRLRLRGKRLVRLHIVGDGPSVEGILLGRSSGHYILLSPKLLETPDRSHLLDGHIAVPVERVLFVQVLR